MTLEHTVPGGRQDAHVFRPFTFGVTRAMTEKRHGHIYLRANQALSAYPERMSDRFLHWASVQGDKTWLARRRKNADHTWGDWQTLSYASALQQAQSVAQALLDRGLSAERPVAIVSENSLEHAILALACMLVGIPCAPISPPYALVSQDYNKLRHAVQTLTPGLVFAQDGRYARALTQVLDAEVECVWVESPSEATPGGVQTAWQDLIRTPVTPAVAQAQGAVTSDTVLKFLFTSGSIKLPKAVINTHRMWCANQQQMTQSVPSYAMGDLVLVDWLPWHHTFGGNHNFGMVLYNGGTLYLDEGKPTATLMAETLRNLREIAPTHYFNVPAGYEQIAHAMQDDAALRKNLLSRLNTFFYAGASLAQPIWDSLCASAEAEIGQRIVMTSSLGMTESSPFALFMTTPYAKAGDIGLPTPGLSLKLVEINGKRELRYKGPNITPGYWRAPEQTQAAFDEEGYFKSGDAVEWIDPDNIHVGLRFVGRIAEDFKLATGTFVHVGPLRAKIIAAGAPYIQDVVITGHERNELGAMIFPTAQLRVLGQLGNDAPLSEVVLTPAVRAHFNQLLQDLAATASGSANLITRMCIMTEAPTLDSGEITDKGSINQAAVLSRRAVLVQALHERQLPDMWSLLP